LAGSWKRRTCLQAGAAAYIAFLCLYGLAFVILEAITWREHLRKKDHYPSMAYERQEKPEDMGL